MRSLLVKFLTSHPLFMLVGILLTVQPAFGQSPHPPNSPPTSACPVGVVSSIGRVIVPQEVDKACRNELASQENLVQRSPVPARARPSGMPKKRSILLDQEKLGPWSALAAKEVPFPYTDFPYSTIGRLVSKWPKGEPTGCTAASIGNQAIWTAGHCVYQKDLGGWATEVKFAPSYKDGNPPFDWWYATKLFTTSTWIDWGKPLGVKRDMGGAILKLNEKGEKISDVVGHLGFKWNQPYEQYYHFFGYPGDPSPPFPKDLSKMFDCEGQSTGQAWLILLGEGPWMQTMECDMRKGASGGPWITDISNQGGSTNFLNGNTSSDEPNNYSGKSLSPYFDDVADKLWVCLVEGCSSAR